MCEIERRRRIKQRQIDAARLGGAAFATSARRTQMTRADRDADTATR
jgi:hypothetical protein